MFNHALAYVLAAVTATKREEKGATAVEYALVIGLVSIVVVGAVALLGGEDGPLTTFIEGIDFGG